MNYLLRIKWISRNRSSSWKTNEAYWDPLPSQNSHLALVMKQFRLCRLNNGRMRLTPASAWRLPIVVCIILVLIAIRKCIFNASLFENTICIYFPCNCSERDTSIAKCSSLCLKQIFVAIMDGNKNSLRSFNLSSFTFLTWDFYKGVLCSERRFEV